MYLVKWSDGLVMNLEQIVTFKQTDDGVIIVWSDGDESEYDRNFSPEHAKFIDMVLSLPIQRHLYPKED